MDLKSRGDIIAAKNALVTRRGNTGDAAEKQAINAAIENLNGLLQDIDHGNLLAAAQAVASASDELETIVASAKKGPFDGALGELRAAIGRLQSRQAEIHAVDSLPTADVTLVEPLTAPELAAATPPTAPERPVNSTVFAALSGEYGSYFDACRVKPECQKNVDFYVARIRKFKDRYDEVGAPLNVPWYFIGILHGMECGFNFGSHLHNGDPLSARTTHVPASRPANGNPPFTWRDSATDALTLKGYHRVNDWSIPHVLYLLERYNGFGYRRLGVPTPYLWSFSNMYVKGKYVADHKYDANAVSAQCGAALMVKALRALGLT
jgi:lysozyme family protein